MYQSMLMARIVETFGILVGLICVKMSLKREVAFTLMGVYTLISCKHIFLINYSVFAILSIFYWKSFPVCYNDELNKPTVFHVTIYSLVLLVMIFNAIFLFFRRYISASSPNLTCRNHLRARIFLFFLLGIISNIIYMILHLSAQGKTTGFVSYRIITSSRPTIIAFLSIKIVAATFIFIGIVVVMFQNPIQAMMKNLLEKQIRLQKEQYLNKWMIDQLPGTSCSMFHLQKDLLHW